MAPRRALLVMASALALATTACLGTREDPAATTTTTAPTTTTTVVPAVSPSPLWEAARHLQGSYVAAGVLAGEELAEAALAVLRRAAQARPGEAELATADEAVPDDVPGGYETLWRWWHDGIERRSVESRRKQGPKKSRARRMIDWTKVQSLGLQSDGALAAHLGVDRSAVRRARERLGIPAYVER